MEVGDLARDRVDGVLTLTPLHYRVDGVLTLTLLPYYPAESTEY